MTEEIQQGDGPCEKCSCGGWWSWQPGNTECGGCGHS
ncbi:unnamed protein product, partial [Rotaria magnacalcarata]